MSEAILNPADAPVPEPGFLDRFTGILLRPAATFRAMTDPDAWYWPAVMYAVGYLLFLVPVSYTSGRLQIAMLHQSMTPNGSQVPPGMDWMMTLMPVMTVFGT